MKVPTVHVKEDTNEKLPNFTISSQDDIVVLKACERKWRSENLEVNLK